MQKPVVLIVDDDAGNLQVLAHLLDDDYHVKVAYNGERALSLAQTKPDLILLDILMPGMDGYEVCERLKSNKETSGIPVIFITGRAESKDEEHGLNLGAVDYIAKPVRPAIVAARVKTHITIMQQQKQLQKMAMHDQLTGLRNRHYLMDVVANKMAIAKRHESPLSMIMLDIDNFKNINDSYGHAIGDGVLRELAEMLKKHCRIEDVAARIGGEEFILLLDHCDLNNCKNKAEEFRQHIEELMPQNIKVTASFGVTEYLVEDEVFDSFFSRADKALYNAKENGRNRIEVS